MPSQFFRRFATRQARNTLKKAPAGNRPQRSFLPSLEPLETRILPAGHLAVTLTGPTTGSVNQNLAYSAVGINDGDTPLNNVDLFIIAGALSLSNPVGSAGLAVNINGQRVDGTISTLAAGQSIRLDVTATANSDQAGKVYQIISNEVSQTLALHGAALVVDFAASPPVNAIGAFNEQLLQTGQLITYTETLLANRGPDQATNVKLQTLLDFETQLSFVSAAVNGQSIQVVPDSNQGITVPLGTVGVGNLAVPDVVVVTYRVLGLDLIGTNVTAMASADQPRTGAGYFFSTHIRVLPDRFQIQAPASAATGSPFDLTVSAVNTGGAPDSSYRGVVSFSSLDLAATLPADYTFTAADNGVHTFHNAALNSLGAQTITATEKLLGPLPPTVIAGTTTVLSLSTNANATFVQQLYQDLLGRAADPGGLNFWTGALQQNGPRAQVTFAIEQTSEYRSRLVESLYSSLLGRQADPGGLAFCVNSFQLGATLAQVEAVLLGSPEYFQKRGNGNTAAFLNALYQDTLGRSVDGGGLAFWSGVLGGTSTGQVALTILTSGEGFTHLVQEAYGQFLGRAADPGGTAFFVGNLSLGGRYETLVAQLTDSTEYFNKSFVDRQAPVVTVLSPANGALVNTNPTISGRVTDNQTGVARLQRQVNLGVWQDVPFDANGNFSFTTTFELDGSADNTHSYRFKATDRAGNVLRTGDMTFTLDTVPPSAPPAPHLSSASDSGNSNSDGITNVKTPTFLVDIEPGEQARLYVDGLQVAAGGGASPVSLISPPLADGVHKVVATVLDAAGNESVQSDPIQVTIITAVPAAPTVVLAAASDSGQSNSDDITNVTKPTVLVDAQPGQTVHLFVDGQKVADGVGASPVSFTVGPLADGQHHLQATLEDAAGNVSSLSGTLTITIDTVAPATPTFDLTPGTDSGPQGDQKTDFAVVSLAGQTGAGATVAVLQTGDSTTAAVGSFTIANVGLRLGDNSLTVRATDVAGNQSTFTRVITRVQAADTLADQALTAYESVLNDVSFVPYEGLQKGAQATDETKAGNDWDQAALLIERLSALGISARFVNGRVSAPADVLANWLGVENTTAVGMVLDAAGANPVASSTVPGNIEFDHVWVEADVPQPGGGTLTVSLDPCWKFKDYHAGLTGLLATVPFDMNGFLSQVRTERAYEFYEDQVTAYLRANQPSLSLADVPHDGPILAQYPATLPTSLPYLVVGVVDRQTTVPAVMEQRANLTLMNGSSVLFTDSLIVPEVDLETITIGYADAGSGTVTPQLRLGGQVVQTGAAVAKGINLDLKVDSLEPGDNVIDHTWDSTLVAGDYAAIGLDVNQGSTASLDRLQAKINDTSFAAIDGQAVTTEDQVGTFLALAISKWFVEYEQGRQVINGLTGAVAAHQGLEFGVATSQTTVGFFANLPIPFVPTAAAVDIPGTIEDSVPIDGDTSSDNARFALNGLSGSSQESALWEELINTPSVSTAKSLEIATAAGIPVFVINQSNKATLLPQLTLAAADVTAIGTAVDAGATVTTPRDPTPLRDWQGVGYIADFGNSVSYLISGGLRNGHAMVSHGGFASGTPTDPTLTPDGTPDQNQSTVDDPVNEANGNLEHDETDITLPGIGLPLDFARHYDSQSTVNAGMGQGWMFSYADFLTFNSDSSITWNTSEGYRYTFTPSGGGFSGPDSLHGTFAATASGYVYRNKDGMTDTFDAQGRLTEMRDRNDNALTISHVGSTNQLSSVVEADAPTHSVTFTYSGGVLTSVADFTGRTWSYSYTGGLLTRVTGPGDATAAPFTIAYDYYTDSARSGLLAKMTLADGGVLTYSYYPNRRVFQTTAPEGMNGSFSYNLYRLQTTHVDPNGVAFVYLYNSIGNLIGTILPDHTKTTAVWANSLLQETIDTFGNPTSFSYDALGNMTQMIDANSVPTVIAYETTFSNIVSTTQAGGRVTQYTYDSHGNVTKMIDAMNGVTTYQYDSHGQEISRTMPNGNLTATVGDFTTTTQYSDAGQVIQVSTDLPTTTSFVYDARGDLTKAVDANGHAAFFVYDIRDRMIQSTDALGQVSSQTFDVMGNLTSSTDFLSRKTTLTYDALERKVQTIFPDGSSQSYSYDANSNVVALTDELGNQTHYQFDARNRGVQTIYADGTSDKKLYNSENKVEIATSAAGNVETYRYDRLWRTTEHDFLQNDGSIGSSSIITYDDVGNPISTADGLGHLTQFAFDLLDRNISITDADNGVTTFQLDADRRLLAVTDASQNKTSYTYDVLGRETSETDPMGHILLYSYDAVGNQIAEVDRDGRERTFKYDALNRLTEEDWLDSSSNPTRISSYKYDATGQMISASDPDSSLAFGYDLRGRITSVSNAGTPHAPTVVVSYAYDAAGNLISTADTVNGAPEGLNAYGYDALNRMVLITQSGSALSDKRVDLAYTPDSLVQSISRSADLAGVQQMATTTNVYDFMNRLTSHNDANGSTELASESLTYDAASRITQIATDLSTTTYAYDNINELVDATNTVNSSQDDNLTYDPTGNRSSANGQAVTTSAGNQLQSDGVYDYTYDAEGNLVVRTEIATGNTRNFQWDYRNRLIAVTDKNASGTVLAQTTYTYDVFDRRIVKAVDADVEASTSPVVTQFVYDGSNVLLEFSGLDPQNSKPSMHYLYGPAVDQIMAQDAGGGQTAWLLADHLGSVSEVLDNSGSVVDRLIYDSFGHLVSQTDAAAGSRYGFAGREFDAETGLYFNRSRFYDPTTGRFLNEDSSRFAGGDANLYRYVGNNPVSQSDPTGHFVLNLAAGGIGAVIGGGFGLIVGGYQNGVKGAFKGLAAGAAGGFVGGIAFNPILGTAVSAGLGLGTATVVAGAGSGLLSGTASGLTSEGISLAQGDGFHPGEIVKSALISGVTGGIFGGILGAVARVTLGSTSGYTTEIILSKFSSLYEGISQDWFLGFSSGLIDLYGTLGKDVWELFHPPLPPKPPVAPPPPVETSWCPVRKGGENRNIG
jgi:RHS repeat-associated protein/uncharacterized repeat protein (TIGR01451 family)